jgi:myxalamid-type polyketide synthase MxaE and MxaD
MLESLGRLYEAGAEVDWAGFDRDYRRRRVWLPTYPFERQRHWPERPASAPPAAPRPRAGDPHPMLGRRLRSPLLNDVVFETEVRANSPLCLDDHRVHGIAVFPAAAYIAMALAAGAETGGTEAAWVVADLVAEEPVLVPDSGARLVQVILGPAAPDGRRPFQVASAPMETEEEEPAWVRHATGQLVRDPEDAMHRVGEDGALTASQARCAEVPVGIHYDQWRAAGLELGRRFRAIARLWRRDGEAVGQLARPVSRAGAAHGAEAGAVLLDGMVQVLRAALPQHLEGPYLLSGVKRLRLRAPLEQAAFAHALVRTGGAPDDTVCGDLRLCDPDGRVLGVVEGMELQRVGPASAGRLASAAFADWLYEVSWIPKVLDADAPARRAGAGPGTWLVLADEAGVGARLAERLRARGDRCVMVAHGESVGADEWRLDPARPEEFDRLVDEAVGTRTSPLLGAIHLWSVDAREPAGLGPEALEQDQVLGAGSLLHLVQAVARRSPVPVWVVTRGAHAVAGPAPCAVSQSAVWGLGRVIALEHPEAWGGLVDLDPDGDPREIDHLLEEVLSGDGEDQVALRGGLRRVARLVRDQGATMRPLSLRADGAYLITGGLGRLGLAIARWMAERGARHLVLVGRRGLPERSEWAALPAQSEAACQAAEVREVEARGAVVDVVAADVTDPDQARALMARFSRSTPPLRGVIHAATSAGAGPLRTMSLHDLQVMLRPKVAGAWALHCLTEALDLDFFALFSSTAAWLGSRDLGHYAAANAFLDALAHHRRALGLPALSIAWGAWDQMRSGSFEQQRMVEGAGMRRMPSQRALAALGNLLGSSSAHVVVAAVDWPTLKPVYEARRRRPLLERLGNGHVPSRPPAPSRADLRELLASSRPQDRTQLVQARVRAEVARVLGLDAGELDVRRGLFDLGLDSLMVVELRRQLEGAVGCPLPATLAFNHPTAAALSAFLAHEVLKLDAPAGPDAAADDDEAVPPPASRSDLSEEDLAALLAEKLAQLS